MNWNVVSPALVYLFRQLASGDMSKPLPEYTVSWLNRGVPIISPETLEGTYLQVIGSQGYGKPAKDWLAHQIATLVPTDATEGAVYAGLVGSIPWTYTVQAGEDLASVATNIGVVLVSAGIPGLPFLFGDPTRLEYDVFAGQEFVWTSDHANLTVTSNTMVQEALVRRGKLTLQVTVKSLEDTDVSWSLYYLENIQTNIWSEVSLSFLRALGLGIIDVGSIRDHSAPIDQREASIGSLDIKFSFVDNRLIPVDYSTIEHVSGVLTAREGANIMQVPFQADKP